MKPRRQDFVVGLSALIFLGLFVGTILFLVPLHKVRTYPISVQFRHAEGLAPIKQGSPVVLSGAVEVGKVTAVRPEQVLVAGPGGHRTKELVIVADAEIDHAIELYGDAQITSDQPAVGGMASLVIIDVGTVGVRRVETQRFMGLPPQSLAATIGTLSRRLLGPDGLVEKLDHLLDPNVDASITRKILLSLDDINVMTSRLAAQLDPAEQLSLLAKVHGIVDNVNAASESLRDELDAGRAGNIVEKTRVALDALSTGLVELSALLKENREPLSATIANVESLTGKLNDELADMLIAQFDPDNPASVLGKVHGSMDALNRSLAHFESISSASREIVLLSRPALEATIANIKEMSEQLRLTGEEVRIAPWRLMYKPTGKESEQMTVFEATRAFADAADHLNDTAARLEAAIKASPPGANEGELAEMRASLRQAFERFKLAEDYLFRQMNRTQR